MKNFFLTSLLAASCCAVQAQTYFDVPEPIANGPVHPLIDTIRYLREDADSLVYTLYDVFGSPQDEKIYDVYKRNASKTADTIYHSHGKTFKTIKSYDLKNQLQLVEYYFAQGGGQIKRYTYDSKGRVRSLQYYTFSSPTQPYERVYYTYLDEQAQYVTDGYVHTFVRETKSPVGDIKTDSFRLYYAFDTLGQLIQVGEIYYKHFENNEYLKIEHIDPGLKHEEYYDHTGRKRASLDYTWDGYWQRLSTKTYDYFKKGVLLRNEPLASIQTPRVFAYEGAIWLEALSPRLVQVFSFAGQLVREAVLQPNESLWLPSGLYLIKIENQFCKIVVK